MATVHWSLEVRGRVRPKAVLVDADGREVARVVRDGRVRSVRAGGATDERGRTWRVVGPANDLRVSCDGVARATIVDGVLEVGDRAFGWRIADDGSRTLRVTSAAGGGILLRVDPGTDGAWARIVFDDALPEPFGIVLAASVRLLEAEDPIWGREGPGTGSRQQRRGADAVPEPPSVQDADGAAPLATRWSLVVEGRVRPRVLLQDGGDGPLATLALRGGPAGSLGTATDRDGRRWVAELDGGVVTVRCAGRTMARAEREELTVGGRTLAWRASLDGVRTGTVTDDDGRELLRVAPDRADGGPWVTVELDDALPSPLAATLATLFVLLRVDALGRRG